MPGPVSANRGKKLLCFSADAALSDLMSLVLRPQGFEITGASSVGDTILWIGEHKPEIIVVEQLAADYYDLLRYPAFYRHYHRGQPPAMRPFKSTLWFERIPDSGPDAALEPEPLRPAGPGPKSARAEVQIPYDPVDLDLRGKPLPPGDVD